ncbi:hypothetical protein GIB67_013251 [Kingdonia uniflora]|uniref:Pectinesterase inhibitor domain-containing protein n=1 Tax=Kingdonia uniflora TaxID=39325 RepID=A0A7J7NSX0_9MAGN|nr:hypothetical protein GIB67_013251 [Kingdonia uniflora]
MKSSNTFFFKGYDKVAINSPSNTNNKLGSASASAKGIIIVTFSAVATLLILMIIIGAALSVHVPDSKEMIDSPNKNNTGGSSNMSELIKSVCGLTGHPESCTMTLLVAAADNTSRKASSWSGNDKQLVLLWSLQISLKELSPLPENYHQRLMMNTTSSTKEALRDCETLLSDAIDQVNTSISRMNDSEAKMNDIRTWVSSAMTDEETCLNGLEETSSSSMPMEEGQGTDNVAITSREEMKRSREWLSNSLAIAANIPN